VFAQCRFVKNRFKFYEAPRIFLDQSIIVSTIEDLLWQAGVRDNLLQSRLKIEKLAQQLHPPEL